MASDPTPPLPVRCSVAAVVRRADAEGFLVVRRPQNDRDLPGVWGFPAVTLKAGEMPEEGVRRIGHEKLGVGLDSVRLIGIKAANRGAYQLILMDVEARLHSGEPDVFRATADGTRYVDQMWVEDAEVLRDGAARGSLCCQIFLESTPAAPGAP